MGWEFQELLISYGIKSKPTTIKNPTAQAAIERLNLLLGDQLRTTVFEEDWEQDVESIVQSCAWAMRSTATSTCQHTPGQKEQRRTLVLTNNRRENRKRRKHTNKVGDKYSLI